MTAARRVALVTGGANGIGLAIGELLAARGVDVVLADRDESVFEAASRIGASALRVDVADPASIAACATLPSLDVLVNCAAIAPHATLDSAELAQVFARTVEVNVTGALGMVTAVLPQLTASAAGRILNIGSVQGFAPAAENLAYSASKAALHNLTRGLAVDLASRGILVNALAPGFVDTAMSRLPDGSSEYDTDWFRSVYVEHGRIPLRRPARASEIALAAEFFVSEANTYTTGVVLPVDGGLLATF